MRPTTHTLAALLLILAAGPQGAGAQGGGWSFIQVRDPRATSLDEAVSGARQRTPGRVLSADTVDENGRPVHRIRILTDEGRVRGLRYDGETGQPIQRPPPRER